MPHARPTDDVDHARAESALAQARALPLRARPLQQLSDAERNDLVLADFWARRANERDAGRGQATSAKPSVDALEAVSSKLPCSEAIIALSSDISM